MDKSDKLLEEYSKEMGLSSPITLEELISSHRHLREQSKSEWRIHRENCKNIYDKIEKEYTKTISEKYYIERLKSSNWNEIIQILKDDATLGYNT